ncbi:hypothetical protein GHT06_020163 [Daphnia sinensis]|uniref:Uncharacterized protein n=1 Tax=Daphnia sinensis TaxID=1820382 RepID=A0AAD5KL33_9CRUS|nr:hypothetical protein GHT06_020163 [Daphnia sinensis]
MSYEELMTGLPTVRPSLPVSIDLIRLRRITPEGLRSELEATRKRVQQALLAVPKPKRPEVNNMAKTKAPVHLQTPAMRAVLATRTKLADLHRRMFGGRVLKPATIPAPKSDLMRPRPSQEMPKDLAAKRKREEEAPEGPNIKKRFKGTNSKEFIRLPPVLSLKEINELEAKKKRARKVLRVK